MRLLLTVLLLPAVLAFNSLPRRTDPAIHDALDPGGKSAVPTAKPDLSPLLFGRRASGRVASSLAPDVTCGYVSGWTSSYVTCNPGYRCGATYYGTGIGLAGCYNTAEHHLYLEEYCINYAQLNGSCGQDCLSDFNTRKCASSSAPYCQQYSIHDVNAVLWQCVTAEAGALTAVLQTTYRGEAGNLKWTPVYGEHVSQTSHNNVPSSSDTSSTSTSAPAPAATTIVSNDSGSSTPVGAIVGGVIGGLAVICIFVGAIVLFCLRSRRRRSDDTPVPSGMFPPNPKYGPTTHEPSILSSAASPPQPTYVSSEGDSQWRPMSELAAS